MRHLDMTLTIWIARHGPIAGRLLGGWLLLVAFTLPYAFDLWNTASLTPDTAARAELLAVPHEPEDPESTTWWAIDVGGELVPCSGPPGRWKYRMDALYDPTTPTRCRYEGLIGIPSPLERGLFTAVLLGFLGLLAALGFTVYGAWREAPQLARRAESS